MQTDEQGSPDQIDPAGEGPGSSETDPTSAEPDKQGSEGNTVAVSKTDWEESQRLAKDGLNYKGAVERLESENSELKTRVEELAKAKSSVPIFGQIPENMTDEEAKGIERDFKRQSRDVLGRNKELSELTPRQRKVFDKEYQLRSSVVFQDSLSEGELVPVSHLEEAFETALRFTKGQTSDEEIKKARLQGQRDMMDRETGDAGATGQSPTDRKVDEISAEALAEAERSLLVKDGLMSKEEMAKRIQKRINEGK